MKFYLAVAVCLLEFAIYAGIAMWQGWADGGGPAAKGIFLITLAVTYIVITRSEPVGG